MSAWDVLLQQIINGVSLGAMYSLLALGFTMVYGIIELINFAHFNVFMVGSFIALWLMQAMGIVGQSTILYGLPLIGVLVLVRQCSAQTRAAPEVSIGHLGCVSRCNHLTGRSADNRTALKERLCPWHR